MIYQWNTNFSVWSLNVNQKVNFGNLHDRLRSDLPDLVFLQECIESSDSLNHTFNRFGYRGFSSICEERGHGVAVLYRDTLPIQDILPLEPGALLLVNLEDISFINIYAPSGNALKAERRKFFSETLLRNLQLRGNTPILIGDFNCVLHRQDTIDNFKNKQCFALSELVNLFGYLDGFRVKYPMDIAFTFNRPSCSPSRLDRIYLPPRWVQSLVDITHSATTSDHKVLAVELEFRSADPVSPVRVPYWKMNVQILQDPDFILNFHNVWNRLVSNRGKYANIALWWDDYVKPGLKYFLQQFSIHRVRRRRQTKSYLFSLLDLATDEQDWEQVSFLRSKLKEMFEQDMQGFMVRSRSKGYQEREIGSLYSVGREVKQGKVSNLGSLLIDGVEVQDKKVIEEEVTSFFETLFQGRHRSVPGEPDPVDSGVSFKPDWSDLEEFLEGLGQVSPPDRITLQRPVTLEEVTVALKTCASNRSPGLDGIPYELYKATWNIIGPTVVELFQYELDNLELIQSNRVGATRLLNKVPGQVPTVNQLRPITLLCTDYKLLSKVLVKRINTVLPDVLTAGQLCSTPPKNILFGAVGLLSSIDYINKTPAQLNLVENLNQIDGIPAYMVSFDIFKAYDKTVVEYICRVMEGMSFPPMFISWIKMLHTECKTRFILNFLTGEVSVQFSLRQGDPMAMPLFLINMEPLLLYIRRKIKGVQVAAVKQKDEDYVDDINVISSCLRDLGLMDMAFFKYEALAGMVLNRSRKSLIMGLGAWKGRHVWPLTWLQTVPSMKTFGIHFHPTYEETVQASWQACLTGVRKCLMSWASRALPTLSQRVKVLETYALSKLWYLAQVIPLPQRICNQLDVMVRAFLWKGRLEHLAYDELYAPPLEGGLGLSNIKARCDALFVKQLCRILQSPGSHRDHLKYWLGLKLRGFIPELGEGANAPLPTPLFKHAAALMLECLERGCIDVSRLPKVSAKKLYKEFMETPPPPKVLSKYPGVEWDRVWRRIQSCILEPCAQDLMFSLIHNILPTRDRLLRLNHLVNNSFCESCPGQVQDITHVFTQCGRVREAWEWTRSVLVSLDPVNLALQSDMNLIHLFYPASTRENDFLFILSNYLEFVWFLYRQKFDISLPRLKGYLKFKLHSNKNNNVPRVGFVPQLL